MSSLHCLFKPIAVNTTRYLSGAQIDMEIPDSPAEWQTPEWEHVTHTCVQSYGHGSYGLSWVTLNDHLCSPGASNY